MTRDRLLHEGNMKGTQRERLNEILKMLKKKLRKYAYLIMCHAMFIQMCSYGFYHGSAGLVTTRH